jgi:hypothetical protein
MVGNALRIILLLAACVFAKTQKLNCVDSPVALVRTCQSYFEPRTIALSATDVGASNLQIQNQWCWAASIEMAFRYYGYFIPQAEIVRQTWGVIINMPAQPADIMYAVNRTYTDANGKTFRVQGIILNNWNQATFSLGNDKPVLVGSQGHMTLLYGLQYHFGTNLAGNQTTQTFFDEAAVIDPWPGNGVRDLSPMEFNNTLLAVEISTQLVSITGLEAKQSTRSTTKLIVLDLLGRQPSKIPREALIFRR